MKQSDGCILAVKRCVKQIGETRNKTRDEMHDETSNETCKRKMKDVSKPTSGIRSKWQIVTQRRWRKTNKNPKKMWRNQHSTQEYQINEQKTEISTSASAQTVLTVVKDEFTEVFTKGTLSPTTKPADWNVVIT
jgi:hypothetical protein